MNNILFYFFAIVSYYLLVLVFKKISRSNFKLNFINIALIIIFSIINSLSFMDNLLIIKTIISIGIFILINKIILKLSIKESLVVSIIYLIITLFGELIVLLMLSPFNIINDDYINSISTLKAVITVVVMLFTYLIISIKVVNNAIYKMYRFFVENNKYIKYIVFAIIQITFICLLYIINYSKKNLFFMNLLFYIAFIAVILLIGKTIYKNKKLNLINELLLNNEESYVKVIESYQMFKHNVIHEFNCIKSIGNSKVNKIIDGYIKEHKTPVIDQKIMFSIPKSIRTILYNNIVKNALYSLNISVDNFASNDIIYIISTTRYIKLCQILGIILDNAVEACKECKKPYLYLYLNEDKSKYYIKVVNEFSNNIHLLDENKINKSSKKGHMGVGLKYVYNSSFDVKSTIRNNKFITSIVIKK
ncbi:MAG: GHKL domain-containing protein [Bacilli bacterium]|nr:GHKL domain-containing protein [Bacilli bacterium]